MHTNLVMVMVCILTYPFVLSDELKQIKVEIGQEKISIIFYGTTRLGEALAVVIQFVAEWKIEQHLIRLQLLTKSMTEEEIDRELVSVLSVEYSISVDQLAACM